MQEPQDDTFKPKHDPETGELILDLPAFEVPATEGEQVNEELGRIAEIEKSRLAPPIDNLDDAALRSQAEPGYVFLPAVGEKVIIERSVNGRWLDTETYTVVAVDPISGGLRLMNHSLHQAAQSNFITGLERGYRFKLPDGSGHVGKRTRGRPKGSRKKLHYRPAEGGENNETQQAATTTQEKRRRGRPKGAKNRDRETIAREKLERQQKREEKRRKRDLKKKKGGK